MIRDGRRREKAGQLEPAVAVRRSHHGNLDVQGTAQLKEKVPDTVSIFVLPPDREELEWRLQSRGLDAEDVIQRRLAIANHKMENYRNYDYVLVNERFEECGEQLLKIVLSERERRSG